MIDDRVKFGAIAREIEMRQKVYPRLVAEGKITQDFADLQIAIMREIAGDYQRRIEPMLWDERDEPA